MAFLTKLREHSPAYAAYSALPRLPKNTPLFPDSPHGYPIVENGEVFCRLEGIGRPCCGYKAKSTDLLLYHMEAVHSAMRRDRPLEKRGKVEIGEVERLHYFFKHLMKDEDYVGKKTLATTGQQVKQEGNDVFPFFPNAARPDAKRKKPYTNTTLQALKARANLKRKAVVEQPLRTKEPSIDSVVAQMKPPPAKRPRIHKHEAAHLRGQELLQDIAVKEATIKSELKESQLKEVRVKAELLEIQLVEAQVAQEVQEAKLKQIELEKQLAEIVRKEQRVKQGLGGAVEEKGKVVDLLGDESD